ncbi:S9 family peptidase [Flavihumibacter solisilvae]|uniref:Peptidase S9 n=1 Tax=Flavihumibacter solisilvae TaxID=1349421 RepID=A0A0C1LCR8_9BACT|nr:prolyl oligopeptidase family serine peptidase [Flavihumibacter solisilvae]KIC93303.1 peptidase S9 [Flavihumibacter solisilvae]
MKRMVLPLLLMFSLAGQTQQPAPELTVDMIMRDPKWIGTSPSNPFWSNEGRLYFSWNPEKALSDSLYFAMPGASPVKASWADRQALVDHADCEYNKAGNAYTYVKNGDVFYVTLKPFRQLKVTQTLEPETMSHFAFNDMKLVFLRSQNLFSWDLKTGETVQLTNFQKGAAPAKDAKKDGIQEKWLKDDQLKYFEVLRLRKNKREVGDSLQKQFSGKPLRAIYLEEKNVGMVSISADGRFISYRLTKPAVSARSTIVPNYVTESGFTEDIPARTKVGAPSTSQELFIFDTRLDTIFQVTTDSLPGIRNAPEYFKDYPGQQADQQKKNAPRTSNFTALTWSPSGYRAVADIRSTDNKDRWLVLVNGLTGKYSVLDHQHDSAWIGGPGIGGSYGGGNYGWLDAEHFWFQSEKTGFSHLYRVSVSTAEIRPLTSGKFEIQNARLSANRQFFYLTSNEVHPGEQHFYRLPVNGGTMERITSMTGANQVTISPDEKKVAILYSYSNKPWELYLQDNKPGSKAVQVTNKAVSEAFAGYPWRDPELVTFKARDGATVYARLYKPSNPHPSRPAVIFVHGAGYLQNVHKWWSSYFREYMFHNLLADKGYTVLDIDYRASSGYGRDWRTGIYRFMGGKDLTDHIDGAGWLVNNQGVNARNIGIYGGSYGGFITLMAMFTTPGVFASGAALRPVTDWAHYNHGYTSNILNEPVTDSIAYRRSSPIYHAEGFKGNLLICHGMVDVNVHYEDVVRLGQRLIELGKENWEIASYPVEDHGFVEPSSWTDEYKRILKLFEQTLKQ